jgi:hypothetical protein
MGRHYATVLGVLMLLGLVLPPRNTQVFASELEVFRSDPRVEGAQQDD